MPERSLLSRILSPLMPRGAPSHPSARRVALLAAVVLATTALAACTDDYDGGQACPVLCPQVQAPFVDTIIEAIALDTTLGPYPILGFSNGLLLANRGDTLKTHVIVRFDNLPSTYNPNGQAVPEQLTTVDSTVLRFFVDTSGTRSNGAFTIEVFDVDTSASDSVSAVVASLFRVDRKVGQVIVPAGSTVDSLRIPISKTFIESKIAVQGRVRLGVRILSTDNAQMRFGAFAAGEGAPRLTFDPSTDTLYRPLDITPRTTLLGAELDDVLRLAYTVYTLTVIGSEPVPPGTLSVGGFPSRRPYLRFAIPRAIIDSSTVVRAELLLTQKPAFSADRGRPIGVQPYIGTTSNSVTDLYLAASLAANGRLAGVDSVRFVPSDSGPRALNIVSLVRGWSTLDSTITRFIALRMNGEGSIGSEIRFHDLSAPAALRPRLRITYLPRTEFAIP